MTFNIIRNTMKKIIHAYKNFVVVVWLVLWELVHQLIVTLMKLCEIVNKVVHIVYYYFYWLNSLLNSLSKLLMDQQYFFTINVTRLLKWAGLLCVFNLNLTLWALQQRYSFSESDALKWFFQFFNFVTMESQELIKQIRLE